jgi:hypothetical protein
MIARVVDRHILGFSLHCDEKRTLMLVGLDKYANSMFQLEEG